jgi:hypothetical protein
LGRWQRPAQAGRAIRARLDEDVSVVRSVAEHVADPRHAGDVGGAPCLGEASSGDGLVVRMGLWRASSGAVVRARFRSTSCAALIAYSEAACRLAEDGALGPGDLAARIRAAVDGVHPAHCSRADLVALALVRALAVPGGSA